MSFHERLFSFRNYLTQLVIPAREAVEKRPFRRAHGEARNLLFYSKVAAGKDPDDADTRVRRDAFAARP